MPTPLAQVGSLAPGTEKVEGCRPESDGPASASLEPHSTPKLDEDSLLRTSTRDPLWRRGFTGDHLPFDAPPRARYNLPKGSSEREVRLPLYEYQCKKCGRRVEKIQKFSDLPLTTCEGCGGKLERLLSSSAIQFKGSGSYVTDYARGSSSTNPSSAADPSDGPGKKTQEPSKPSEPVKPSPSKD